MIRNLVLLACLLGPALPAAAQSRFSPAIEVGDAVVTRYQLDQRTLFLSLLGAPGDTRELAREQLINEAIQTTAARDAGVVPDEAEVLEGMNEFAARANLTADQMAAALGQKGVGVETFRDFIGAGVAWRSLVREKFGEAAGASIAPRDVRRTFAETGTEGGVRYDLLEIVLPTTSAATAAASRARAAKLRAITGEADFRGAARTFSIAPSSQTGGDLGWVAAESLPPGTEGLVASLRPGQVGGPVETEGGLRLYLLRARETVPAGVAAVAADYALLTVSGGAAEAATIASRATSCNDMDRAAGTTPGARLERQKVAIAALPGDVRAELAALDEGEVSTRLTRNGQATVLMLCERTSAGEQTVDLQIVGNRLLNERLGAEATNYLTELRAMTDVRDVAR